MAAQARILFASRLVLAIALLIAGVGLIVFFGLRAYHTYNRFQQSELSAGATDVEAIRGWMTLPYIARAYGVPEEALFAALDIPKSGNERLSLKQLVAQYQRDPQATRGLIQRVLLDHQRAPAPAGAP